MAVMERGVDKLKTAAKKEPKAIAASAFAQDLQENLREVGVEAKEWLLDARGKAEDVYEDVKDQVQAHPVQSLGIAFLAGMITAFILGRR